MITRLLIGIAIVIMSVSCASTKGGNVGDILNGNQDSIKLDSIRSHMDKDLPQDNKWQILHKVSHPADFIVIEVGYKYAPTDTYATKVVFEGPTQYSLNSRRYGKVKMEKGNVRYIRPVGYLRYGPGLN